MTKETIGHDISKDVVDLRMNSEIDYDELVDHNARTRRRHDAQTQRTRRHERRYWGVVLPTITVIAAAGILKVSQANKEKVPQNQDVPAHVDTAPMHNPILNNDDVLRYLPEDNETHVR